MKTLSITLTLVASLCGCTAVDNFGAFRFSSELGPTSDAASDGGVGQDGFEQGDGSADFGPPANCGAVGDPCCPGMVQCFGGGCCDNTTCRASGSNIGAQVCHDGKLVSCGMANDPCCGNTTCHNGGCCVGGLCAADATSCGPLGTCAMMSCVGPTTQVCGGSGDVCCAGSPGGSTRAADFCVASGVACENGKCATCGGQGEPCCAGNQCETGGCCDQTQGRCVSSGSQCSGGQGTCQQGGCQGGTCGKRNQACCANGVACTNAFTACAGGTCIACGGANEPCCPGRNGGNCSEPFVCETGGVCRRCGEAGQPCCPGDVCNQSLVKLLCSPVSGKCGM